MKIYPIILGGLVMLYHQLEAVPQKLTAAERSEMVADQRKFFSPEEGKPSENKSSTRHKRDLLAQSTILASKGTWTIVPKGAVVHVPEYLRKHVVVAPAGKLVSWAEFLKNNRRVVKSMEVQSDVANGLQPIDELVKEQMMLQRVIVVAVKNRNPIAVRRSLAVTDL
ncbi:hypothetical protein [Persicirhabdus sediminis]|uniref:Uncharacterized protein n=1 Tax=Persicirhabdus sediminis TaxID=454144 RepID=A0A8J7MF41_9BACT|nr:hypothetical protein [Persicirhabdus sediminis]MBK1791572.1 hypothetical protein [Persicirhabdus sediminis]